MKNYLFAVVLVFVLAGCKVLLEKKYGMNKPFTFKDRQAYTNHLSEKGFPVANVLYLDDSSAGDFYEHISTEGLSVYFGSFLNDSTEVRKTALLKENLGCAGRVIKEISGHLQQKTLDTSLLTKSDFRRFQFRRLDNKSVFAMPSPSGRLSIFMIYGYSLGSLYDSMYEEITRFYGQNKSSADLYIISLDPVSSLP